MKDLKLDFLLDIWADLKAKRLAPVAIALAVALVAIPALLLKGGETGGPSPLPITAPAADRDARKVEVARELADGNSKLEAYDSRDPFKSRVKGGKAQMPKDGAAIAPGDQTGETKVEEKSSSGGDLSSGSTGSTKTEPKSKDKDNGSADTGSGRETVPDIRRPKPTLYNFVLDLKFGKPGREKHYHHLSRSSFLKTAGGSPVALFMGVDESAKRALFFVHPGLNHQGEGVCIPNPENCSYLRLAVGKEHYISAGDHEFRLELLGINRVRARSEETKRAAARKAMRGRRLQRGDGAAGPSVEEVLLAPFLVDAQG